MKTSALAALISFFLLTALCTLAQDPATPAPLPDTGVVLVKLSPLIYPPLARQARIMGDVKLYVHVQNDGRVESLELFSGHPMLAPAAIESAKKSQFECRDCDGEGSSYLMIYTFGFLDDGKARETVSQHPARAAKCLYLWNCGTARTSTWQCPENRPTEIYQLNGHITILASTVCVEANSSYEANERPR
jgi:TonB family protein